MTHAACSTAVGEHQPCSRWTTKSAGIAAERTSGYLAMCASISARTWSGTGVVAGSGTTEGSFVRSAASSQPGTREPCAKRRTLLGSIAISSPIDSAEDRVEHGQARDQVGDVAVAHHRWEGLQVHERRIAHVHAGRLRGAVGAHEAAVLAARALDRVVDLARRHAEALGDKLEVVDQRLHRGGQL